MKNFKLFKKLLVLAIVLLTWNAHAYAWNPVYFIGDPTSNWTSNKTSHVISNNADEGSAYFYFAKNNCFAVYITYYNEQAGPADDKSEMNVAASGAQKFYIWGDGENKHAAKYVGNSGIVEVHAKQKDNGDDQPWVWLTRPTVYIRHKWNNSSTSTVAMTDNNDGTYKYTGYYSSSSATIMAGPANASSHSNIFKDFGSSNYTKVGSPTNKDKCIFEWNPSGYRSTTSYNSDRGTLTVTKLYSVTYDGNGKTSGDVPSGVTDRKWNVNFTTATKGTLAKTGYVFVGWNTASDGTGRYYAPNTTYAPTEGSMTLYAMWMQAHSPAVDETYYGEKLTKVGCDLYEVYRYAVSSNTLYINAGTSAAPATSGTRVVLSVASCGSSTKDSVFTTTTWMAHSKTHGVGTVTSSASGEFPGSHSICNPGMRQGQGFILVVTGYDQFSLYAKDANTTGDKQFHVYINDMDVTASPASGTAPYSSAYSVRRYSLTAGNVSVIRVVGHTDNNSLSQGFSLHIPSGFPAPSAFSCSSVTSNSATLSLTDGYDTNDYEFYYSTDSDAPTSGTSATTSSTSKTPTITGLSAETKYYIWVRSKCSNSCKSAWKALSGDYFTTNAASTTYAVSAVTSTGDNSKGSVSAAVSELAASETTTITASPATGYQVTNWAVSGTGASISPNGSSNSNTTTLTMGTADATVTVTFGLKDYTVDYNTPSNGNYTTKVASGSATSADKTAQMGQTVALVATPSSGYVFASWTITDTDASEDVTSTLLTGSKSTTASTSFTMPAADISIVATFARLYTVTKGTHENGDFTISSTSAVAGTSITLTATPNTGYVFDHWTVTRTSGSGSATITNANVSPTTFTMPSGDVTVVAVFKATPNIYYYKDATHYTGGTYKNPEGNTASGSDNVSLTTPWTICNACVTGASVVATSCKYDNKTSATEKWATSYIKLRQNDEGKITFTIAAGYTGTISLKSSGWDGSKSYTMKLSDAGDNISPSSGSMGGQAQKENNFNLLTWSNKEAGAYVFKPTTSGKNLYISEIDIRTTPKVYTLTFVADDGERVGTATNVQSSVTVTFDNNNFSAATVKVPVLTGYTFGGYYTAVDGGGVQIVDENGDWQSSKTNYLDASGNWIKAANTTLYAKWTANTYTVNFDCNNGSGTIYHYTIAMGDTYGSGTEELPLAGELPEPSKYGYHFVGWYTLPTGGTLVTKDTQMATASEHTVYAHFEEVTYVYFCNNLGWTNVYVTYDAYWDTYEDKGSGNNGKIYHQMTLVDGTTNIYRDEVPASILASWKGDICFGDTKQGTLGDNGGYNNFYLGKNIFRRDFDSYATMFVPEKAASKDYTKNGGADYYCSKPWTDGDPVTDYRYEHGYWMKYNSSDYRAGYAGYVIKGEWDGENNDYYFKREKDTIVYSVTKYLAASTTYKFRIYKHCKTTNTNSSWFVYNRGASAITSAGCTNLALTPNIAKSETTTKDKFTTTIAGDYTLEVRCDTANGTLKLSIKYPERTDDYFRVVYTWNDGSNHTRIYKTFKRIANGGDTWFEAFVHKSSAVNSRSLKLQRYNTSTSAWEDVEGKTFDLSECTKNGLYSFVMTRSSLDVITLRYVGPYTGTIYLRSDVTAGGWDYYNYASYGNSVMTYSDFSKRQTQNPYSHYYCVYVDNSTTNVAFTIATSNTPSICDTLVGDATIGAASLSTPTYKALPASNPANIRFMYNDSLNTISRAYLKSAQGDGNKRFLVLHGDSKMFDSNGDAIPANATRELVANELEFTDKGNWVYEINLKAAPVAKAKVIAKYNGSDRYLIGGSGDTSADWKTILGGDVSATQYALAGTYDFKTNRLMLAWTPDGSDITANISDVDMLWVRRADNPATQIKFNGGSLTDISVVGAIQFRYDDLVGRVGSWNATTRPYLKYFVSFPFDVNVSNIFGLNEAEYGREYLIQKYNGAKRAKDGYFIADGVSFWETLTIDSVMHANEGYCISMDNDYLNNVSGYGNIWKNKTAGSSVYLYFPANGKMDITGSDGKTTTAAAHLSSRDKEYESGGHKYNMKETDSHWNMVGAPYFSNSEVYSGPSSYYKWHPDNTWKPWLFSGDKGTEYEGVSNNFNAMSCIMVQYQGTITWNATTPPIAAAPRRKPANEKNNLVMLQLLQGEEQVDRAFIELKDGAETGFVLCEDMIKIFNNGKPNLYVHASEYATSYSQVPVESQIVSVGVDIWYSGVYTFSMPSNFNGTAVLIDNYAQTRTNLGLEDYEVSLDPGVITGRFELEININKAPTAIDGVTDGSGSLKDGKAHKFIMNGQMFILQNGMIYDAQGKRVQ